MSVHENSLAAYARFDTTARENEIIGAFLTLGNATDRAVAMLLNQEDLNYVRPTITNLTERGILVEVAGVKCRVTNKTVRVSALTVVYGATPVSEIPVTYDPEAKAPMPPQQTDTDTRIDVKDEIGNGGAHHRYLISLLGPPIVTVLPDGSSASIRKPIAQFPISFQKGGKQEHGVNGITNENLLEIVRHRLACFQAGPFACRENESALNHTVMALAMLQRRTGKRQRRGVEGKEVK